MPHVPGHKPATVVSTGGTYQQYTPSPAAQLATIVNQKDKSPQFSTAPGSVAVPTMGKKTKAKTGKSKFQDIEDKVAAGVPLSPSEQVVANFYLSSAVNPYQQQLQNFIESSPEAAQAYAERFPKTTFLKNIGPMALGAVTGLPLALLEGAQTGIKSLSEGEGAVAAIASGIQNVASDIANAFTPEQAKNLQINQEEKSEIPALLRQENIIKGDATPIDPQFAPFLNQEDSPLETESVDTSSTVYNPETADAQNFDYMSQAMRDFENLYKKNLSSNQTAEEVETETEDTVPGTIDLTKQDDIVLSGDPNEILDTKVDEDKGVMDDMPSYYNAADASFNYPYDPDEFPKTTTYPAEPRGFAVPETADLDVVDLLFSGSEDKTIPPGTVFSPNVVGQTPVLPYTFPGLEPKQNAKGGIATLENGGQAGGGKLTAPSMRDLMGVANLMGIAPRTLSTKDAILPMLSESGEFEPDFLSINQLIFNLARARKPEGRITTDDIQQAAQDISGPNLSNRDDSGYARMSTFEKLKMMADSD